MWLIRLAVIGAAVGSLYVSTSQWTLALPRPGRELTSEQKALVREKDDYFASEGVTERTLPTDVRRSMMSGDLNGPFPTRAYATTAVATREQVERDIAQALAENADVIQRVQERDGAEAAAELRQYITADLQKLLDSIPPEGRAFEVPMVESGTHSIVTSGYSHPSSAGGNPSDPVNVVWYNLASAADVDYIMRNWTSEAWDGAAEGLFCVNTEQWVLFDETSHDGTSHWVESSYGLEGQWQNCQNGFRDHVRIYDSATVDYTHYFYWWSVGTAHYEEQVGYGHEIRGWEPAEEEVRLSFLDDGYLLWFVQDIWYLTYSNSGWHKGY